MICLITPTGNRPIGFTLCAQWMRNQTYEGKVTWIIVDDGFPVSTNNVPENFRENWTIIKVYPKPSWSLGQNTQARNIAAGLAVMKTIKEIEAVFIIEDDDYYRGRYLDRMISNFENYSVIGERNTIYYNVQYRRYVINPNTIHASLFQTAFTLDVLPVFEQCLPNKFIDSIFWSKVQNKKIFYENDLAIGIKGLPGRGGIGAGHNKNFVMRDDRNLNYLRALIGTDANNYEVYYKDQITNKPLFQTR
jgi:hypothetical protein